MGQARKKAWAGIAGITAIGLLGGMLAGCGKDEGEAAPSTGATASPGAAQSASPAASAQAGPIEVSFMMPLYTDQPPKLDGNIIFDEYQKLTNSKITVNYVPNGNYGDKLNLTFAGGDLSAVTMIPASVLKSTTFINAARGGMFWDLTEEIKKYPELVKSITDISITNTSVDGKLYGLPIARPTARVGLVYRKDWFDSLGLKAPSTMEELYATAKELKAKKPGVIPFSLSDNNLGASVWNGVDFLTVSQGGFNQWGLKDGKLEPYFDTAEYKNTLGLLRKMYSEDLINKDFPLVTTAQTTISAGKAAMLINAYDGAVNWLPNLVKVEPDAKLSIQQVFRDKTNSISGHNGVFAISKSKVKTADQLKAILQFFNRTAEQDALVFRNFGIEGTHYKLVNGSPSFISDETKNQFNTNNVVFNFGINPMAIRWPNATPEQTMIADSYLNYAKNAAPNPIDPFVSTTYTEKGGELDKIMYDARVKYIMGEIDEKGYASAYAEWRKQGGDKLIAEYTEAYNKAQGK
ncbi:MAG: ytcQ 2 [Paenibacillaceae bacterium]|jgi:putative aldouronate transport system substrate-binding protein|nr:ytcQ 2 [Paenibacillaceae bacterium]